MIKDRNMSWKYKTEFMAAYNFNFYELATTIKGTIGGTPALSQIGALGVVGVKLDHPAEFARLTFPVPSYWDTANELDVRCIWSDNGAGGTDGMEVTFTVLYQEKTYGTAPTAAVSTTVLDSTIGADAHNGVADVIHATPWGTINADSIASTTDYLTVDVELTADTNDMDPILVGIEWAYLPKMTDGAQNQLTAKPTDA